MKRNCGIDALRILSMFMVVVLHILGQGGVLSASKMGSMPYWVAWFLEIACFCATNCFALISGYVSYQSRTRLSKAVGLWLQVAFYTLLALSVFAVIMPERIGLGTVLDAFFPVGRRHYWYISSYFGLLLLMPLLNIMIEHTPKRVFAAVLSVAFLAFCVMPRILMVDPFTLGSGYSVIWLVLLYLAGAYVHKYNVADRVRTWAAWLVVLGSVLFTFAFKAAMLLFPQNIYPTAEYESIFISYTSPTMVLTALGLLIALSKLKYGKFATKVISLCAPAALGVYLIHTNQLIWTHLLDDFAVRLLDFHWILMPVLVVTVAVVIYAVCTGVELLRIRLFKLIRVDALLKKVDALAERIWNKQVSV